MGVWKRKGSSKPWFYKFEHNGAQKWKGGFSSESDALEAERREKARLENQDSMLTFRSLVEARLTEVRAYCTPNHYKRVETCLGRFVSLWGDLYIGEISTPMVRAWVIKHGQIYGNSWANKHLIFLKSAFSLAIRDGMLSKSPVSGIMKLPHAAAKKVIPALSEIEAILSFATPEESAYLYTVWLTAARVREINNLTWDDVDLEAGTLTLYTRKKKGSVKTPRVIPIVSKVRESLEFMKDNRVKGSPFVFTNWTQVVRHPSDPEKWKYDYRDKFHKRLARLAGVRKINYHELRHHAASYLAAQGVELTVIQKILGHERATTTDIYLQGLPGSLRNGMAALENL